MQFRAFREGSALITCTIFLVVFVALAVGMATMSGANVRISDNQREANSAFASAESGLEVIRYWLSRIRMPSTTPVADYLSTTILDLQTELANDGIDNFHINNDGSIPTVVVGAPTGQSFSGRLSVDPGDPTLLQLVVVGNSHDSARTLRVDFHIKPYKFPIFNYGIATRGALRFPRNPTLTGALENWEADIYVESANDILAVSVGGNAKFDGDIDIGNPLANVSFAGDVQIAGEGGQQAIDDHITVGADPVEFPVPDLTDFKQYATGPVLDSTFTYSGAGITLTNATIRAGTNPTFTGTGAVTIQGILYIEAPNIVTFNKQVSLQGLIVATGDPANPGTNAINFGANFASTGYPAGAQFDALRQEQQGSSILAPGFGVSFTGNFSSVNGVLAANSLYFSANCSATVKGTMISYSQSPTVVDGNISMNFDRSQMVEIPAGFDLFRVLEYVPSSYAVIF
jgi:hypothetical protein